MWFLEITVDTNDGDYRTFIGEISHDEYLLVSPLISAISKFKPYQHNGQLARYNYCVCNAILDRDECKGPRDLYPQFTEEAFEAFESVMDAGVEFGTIVEVNMIKAVMRSRLL